MAELTRRGWQCALIGQRTYPRIIADAMSRGDWPMRYSPDMVAGKDVPGKGIRICGVDAKGGKAYQQTGYHSANSASVCGLEAWAKFNQIPVWIVYHDLTCLRPHEVLTYGTEERRSRAGTGKPSLVVPMSRTRRLDSVFGKPVDIPNGYTQEALNMIPDNWRAE